MNKKAPKMLKFHRGKRRWLASLKIMGIILLFLLLIATKTISAEGPLLDIPDQIPASAGNTVTVPVNFKANGNAISTIVFSVDYDEKRLSFDPTDGDEDGVPDAITFNLPAGFNGSVAFDGSDTDGELDFIIADVFPPLSALPDRTIVYIRLNVGNLPQSGEAAINFSRDPVASFGNTSGQSVKGTTNNGSCLY